VLALLVDEPDRVEDLHLMVGVEARDDLGDRAEVAVDELAQAAVVVHCAGARPAAHEQLEAGDAEGVLDVDGQQAQAERVAGRRAKPVAVRPRLPRARPVLVRDLPDRPDAARVEELRDRQLHLSRPGGG
jgi:hypothetical protein